MKNLRHDVSLRLVKALNAVLITLPFMICWFEFYGQRIASPYYNKGNWFVVTLFLILYVIFGRVYDAFLISMNRISEMVYSQTLASLISNGILYIITWLLTKHLPNPLPLFGAFAGQILLSILWSIFANKWYFTVFPPKKTAVVFDVRRGMEDLISEYGLDKKYTILESASVEECLAGNMKILDGMEVVFLCGVHSHDRNIILKHCVEKGINVFMLPRIGDVIMSGTKRMHMFHLPILRIGRYNPDPMFLLIKRIFDIVSSGIVLIVISPIMLITAIAIKVTDGGPVFYRQCRLTKDGKKFNVLKFRSMRVDAEKDGVARLSTGEKDDRITPVGRFIRKVRIDELPQLLNILGGSMSVVGPRPERPEIAEQYMKELPEFGLRLQAKAGLTGYAQVYGKYNTTPYDKLQMDLMYISNPSIWEDLKIIFATVKILFLPESTEGVAVGQTTASAVEEVAATEEKAVIERE